MKSQLQALESISERPGLYLYLAGAQGYSVIQYNPTLRLYPLFSLNCLLDCILDVQACLTHKTNCPHCSKSLDLYFDPVMSYFVNKVRFDLIQNTFCQLPRSEKKWEKMQLFKQEKISHFQYVNALWKLKDDKDLRECVNNYYYHGILPDRIQKSFMEDYMRVEQECVIIARVKIDQQNQYIQLVVGDGRNYKISLQLDAGYKITQVQYKGGLLLLLVEQVEGSLFKLLVYDLIEQTLGAVVKKAHELTGEKCIGDQLFIILNKQNAKLFQLGKAQIKVFILQNLLRQRLSVSKFSFNLAPFLKKKESIVSVFQTDGQFEGQDFFKSQEDIQSQRFGCLVLGPQQVRVYVKQAIIKEKNMFQIQSISGKFYDPLSHRIYFYQLQPQFVYFIIFDISILSIKFKKIVKGNFLEESIFIGELADEVEILKRTLVVQGCLLAFHSFNPQTAATNLVKSCIL